MNRWRKYVFKNGKTARNRVVVPPMASQTADDKGFVTTETLKHYERLAQSGAGLIFVEYSHIHQSGKGEANQLGVNSDEQVEGLSKISSTIKESGALSGLQIVHVGGKASSETTGGDLLGPSEIPTPIKGGELETPIEMSKGQIENMIDWYVQAARRASEAGFDFVELHAAHGYGLNQWLSPITNQRTDAYGVDTQGRSLLLRRIVSKIKELFPDILLAVRLPAKDHLPGGLSSVEMMRVVQELEKLGVDLIDVSSGLGGWRRPRGVNGQGYLVEDATLLKVETNLPVIGVGGIKTGDFIDSLLVNSAVDFAAVGRAILEAPMEWCEKHVLNQKACHLKDCVGY